MLVLVRHPGDNFRFADNPGLSVSRLEVGRQTRNPKTSLKHVFHDTSPKGFVEMDRQQILGCAIVLGVLFVFLLVAVGVTHHRTSLQGSGSSLLWTDVALLVAYGIAGVIVLKQRSCNANAAATVGAQIGLLLCAVEIANHLIEAFVPIRPFVLIISPVLLTLALLGAAGAMAWQRTRSLGLAVTGGVCCAVVATLITLSIAISFNLFFAARVDWQLREAFATSGMIDPGAFRVKNILEASSEILVRMPLFAIFLAFAGAVIHAWLSRESRRRVVASSLLAPLIFVVGASALWHANAIERAARPPFVMSGVLLTGVALCAAYPIWSVLNDSKDRSIGAKNP
jgi:hypothetical protein